MSRRVIIIGAGYGGMALANLLARSGFAVDVFEKAAGPGGRTGVLRRDGFTFDTGPSWYLMPESFAQYYSLFGLRAAEELELIRLAPGYKVFFESAAAVCVNGELAADAALFERLEPGAGKKLEQYVATSSEIYRLATQHFLYTNFQQVREALEPEVLRRGPRLLPLCLRKVDDHVARQFRDPRLKKILEYHTVFVGSSPFEAPALYSLMSVLDFRSGVYYPRRGMYALIESLEALGQTLGVRYHYDREVESILVAEGRATGVRLRGGELERADVVVSNADLHFTETTLVPPAFRSFPAAYWAKRQPGPSALLISLGVRGSLPQLLHHNLLLVDRWRENFSAIFHDHVVPEAASMYVCNPSKTDPGLAPEGHEALFMLVPLPAGIRLGAEQQRALAQRFIARFAALAGVPDLPERVVTMALFGPDDFLARYHSWQSGALGGESHLLSQSALFRTPNRSRRVRGLYYVGAGTTPGIGLPMCLMSAQLVYKRIVGDKRAGPLQRLDRIT